MVNIEVPLYAALIHLLGKHLSERNTMGMIIVSVTLPYSSRHFVLKLNILD